MKQLLTSKQKNIVTYIKEITSKRGTAPTFREIQKYFGFSSLGTVYCHIQTLKRKKVIKEGKYTQIELVEKTLTDFIPLSIIGEVEQERPPVIWTHTVSYNVPKSFVIYPDTAYLFIAKGDSLHSELIDHEDLLVVQAGLIPEDGDTIFALNQGSVYIKTYFKEGIYVRLESKTIAPSLMFESSHLLIQGVITAVIRSYIDPLKAS